MAGYRAGFIQKEFSAFRCLRMWETLFDNAIFSIHKMNLTVKRIAYISVYVNTLVDASRIVEFNSIVKNHIFSVDIEMVL